jgi:hypothetical protein
MYCRGKSNFLVSRLARETARKKFAEGVAVGALVGVAVGTALAMAANSEFVRTRARIARDASCEKLEALKEILSDRFSCPWCRCDVCEGEDINEEMSEDTFDYEGGFTDEQE